jgi:hypothetical protein
MSDYTVTWCGPYDGAVPLASVTWCGVDAGPFNK